MIKMIDVDYAPALIAAIKKDYYVMDLVLHLTDEQSKQIAALAQQRGYEAPDAYIFSLIVFDAQKRLEEIAESEKAAQEAQPEPPADSLEANFRQALYDMMKERSKPEDPWNSFNDE